MKEQVINIFAAYKFDSNYYNRDDLEKAIKNAIKNTQRRLQKSVVKDIKLQLIEQSGISSGNYVGDFVRESINRASFNIFELSDREPNVTFELGYSMGISNFRYSNKNGYDILIQNEKVSYRDVISDLLGRFITTYEYDTNAKHNKRYLTLQKKIEDELQTKIKDLIQDEKFLKNIVWRLQGEKVYVICPYIPPEDQKKYGVQSAFSEYGDFNTVHEICIFLRGILQCEVEYFHSMKAKEVKDLLDNHLVVVGGPMWNDYTNKLMKDYKLPFQYKCQEGEEDYILNEINNKEYRVSKTRKNGREMITGDYGIFAVLPNKENEDKTVILISGIRSFGGLGATRSFTEGTIPYENCKLIVKTVGLKNYFATLIEIDVPWGEFPYPKKIKQSDTFAYSPEEKLWKVIV